MTRFSKLAYALISLAIYYSAGFFTIYIIALLCGSSWNLNDWDTMARGALVLIGSPFIGLIFAAYTDELDW
jgi:hypothetical protein